MSLTFIDIETTGLNPGKHVPWEIAVITDTGEYCWVLELKQEELAAAEGMALSVGRYYERATEAAENYAENFALKFAPNVDLMPNAEAKRSTMKELTYIAVSQRPMLAGFLAWETDRSHLVGAVPSFDARFVGDLLNRFGYPPTWHYHLVDVEALTAGKLRLQPPWKSRDLYLMLGITDQHFPAHTALGDAKLAKAVYERVMGLPPTYPEAIIPQDQEEGEVSQHMEGVH